MVIDHLALFIPSPFKKHVAFFRQNARFLELSISNIAVSQIKRKL